ncbi:MAG: end-binding protein Ku [Gaiellaceae bacterium]|nr:end-binding protein Ku [Gaiellaceae bacterium]
MPRAIWSGAISFGLVNVPVRMYSAIEEKDLHFHLIHEPDGGRIGFQKFCKKEEKLVPDDEIVKAFEIKKDKLVVLGDEDFEAVKAEGVKTIEISDFVPYEEIDPIYFDRTYFLGPQEGGEKVYALLREAMEQTGLAAIGKYVMRERQHLGCLRVRDGVIALEKMFFHDEIRPSDDLAPGKRNVPKAELELATALIAQFTGTFEPEKYEDTYREALLAVIKAKEKGKTITAPEPEEEPTDLLAALKASVDAAKKSRGSVRTTRPPAHKTPAARGKKTATR